MSWVTSRLRVSPSGKLTESPYKGRKMKFWSKPTKEAAEAYAKGKAVWYRDELGYTYFNVMYHTKENQ
jgi:hypothetical protein